MWGRSGKGLPHIVVFGDGRAQRRGIARRTAKLAISGKAHAQLPREGIH